MKLKEIKPNMAIHCTEREQVEYLVENGFAERFFLDKKIPIWISFNYEKLLPTSVWMPEYSDTAHVLGKTYYEQEGYKCVEFSDLIIPELTAEEAVEWLLMHYSDKEYENAFGFDYTIPDLRNRFTPEKIVEDIVQWKSNHEKKKMEIETVDICRIIEIQPDGRKRCVYEEDIKPDPDLPYGSEQIAVEQILKRYCMEHDGEFIAVHEVVSRVKAVE